MKAFDPCAKVPETLIEAFIDKIIYDKCTFSWYLNPKYGKEIFVIDTTDWKKSMLNRKKTTTTLVPEWLMQNSKEAEAFFWGKYEISEEFMLYSIKLNNDNIDVFICRRRL